MTKIIVTRKTGWIRRDKYLRLFLDNQEVAALKNGEIFEAVVSAVSHNLYAKTDLLLKYDITILLGSQKTELTIEEGETKRYDLSVFRYGTQLMPLMLVYFIILLFGSRFFPIIKDNFIDALTIGMLIICYPLYYFTFGKTKYLRIKEMR